MSLEVTSFFFFFYQAEEIKGLSLRMYGSILAMKSTSKVPSIKSAGKVGKRIKAGENASFSWLEGAKYSGDLLFY